MSHRFLIIASRFNTMITRRLLEAVEQTLAEAGVAKEQVDCLWVPGAFEVPGVAARAARSRAYHAVICLGAVIRGDTPHFDYVAGECARGVMDITIETGVPVVFGVLTTNNLEQAMERAGQGGENKGHEFAQAALTMVKTMAALEEGIKR